ncbi:non-ribosomal peptide synthetase [Streptomyces sp. NPDC047525]|uniref:non-ribosomal peptide synthetase n=1 Tax=Streptomyces sp. NPDC047525 TaxID=3155264 RepID=UPI0033DD729D
MADPLRQPADMLSRFQRAVLDAPDRTAVWATDGRLTFAELDRATACLADSLRARGVAPGDRVGVALPRGRALVVALLSVWRAGAAYVPLDPAYPRDRLAFMAEDSGIRLLLAQDDSAAAARFLPAGVTAVPVRVATDHLSPTHPDPVVPALAPAYVIYTSGSTGTPKGVQATRGGVASLVSALEEAGMYEAGPRVVAWNASASFDASVQQWVRVCRGDTVVVLDDDHRKDPEQLALLLDRLGVTDLDLTPSHWEFLRTQLLSPRADGRVLRLFMGGEPVPGHLWSELDAAGARGELEALNLYGPTECTVDATAAWITGEHPHIGHPLAQSQVRLLDSALLPVPAGAVGEVFIGGPRLAHGYVNQPSLTAARFVPDPHGGPGARMYRTGDRAKLTAGGTLEFVGRVDRQVKLRGFRVELGEIEQVLATHPAVARAAVLVHDGGSADEQLVAYCTPAEPSAQPTADALSAALRDHATGALPAFMVPSFYVLLNELPLTPNGKLDTDALPDPRAAAGTTAVTTVPPGSEPEGAFETLIASVWSEVLGREGIGADDDFFALGGHSLMALRVVARLKKHLGLSVSTKEVYRHPRLRDLAVHVEGKNRLTAGA